MKRVPYPLARCSTTDTDDLLRRPRQIQLTSFNTGEVLVPRGGVFNLRHPAAQDLAHETMWVPVYAHLVQHAQQGSYLIDAGLDSSFARLPYGSMRGLLVRLLACQCRQSRGQDIASRLAERKVKLRGVFFTHLHFDHIAGAAGLPSKLDYVAGAGEWYINIPGILSCNHLRHINMLRQMDLTDAPALGMLGPASDIFGDGSLWAIHTPGHTPGHISFFINGQERQVLVAGDAIMLRANLERGIGGGSFCLNRQKAQLSQDRLSAFIRKYPKVQVVFGHELPPAAGKASA